MSALKTQEDERGKLIEVLKIPGAGQVNYITSKPGVVRGNHYHKRKMENFCVIEGEAKISLRNRESNEIKEHYLSGKKPEIVEVIANWTHNIQNINENELKFLVWVDEIFNPDDPDTYAEQI